MTDWMDRKEVFAWHGAASYYAQLVEVELWNARLLAAGSGSKPSEDESERLENQPLTMGRLIRAIDQEVGLDPDERDMLERCTKKRNWVAHDYWLERNHLLFSAEGCEQAATELSDLCEFFWQADVVASRVSQRVRAALGISEQLVSGLQDEYVERLRAGEDADSVMVDLVRRLNGLRGEADGP